MSIFKRASVTTFVLILPFFFLTGCFKKSETKSNQVNLAIWGNYIDNEQLKRFTAETGIKVNMSNYTSNEELLAKVQAGSSGIDVAVPSDYMVSIMVKLGLLEKLAPGQVPNIQNISDDLLRQEYDPTNTYSLPYTWSTAGIAVNRDLYKGKITGWKDILDNPELAGKFSLLDDVREVAAAALKMNSLSVNSTNKDDLKTAEATLLKARSKVKMFRTDTVEALLKKEVAVSHAYSSDALQAVRQSGGKIEYILPVEGGTRAIDNIVIIKGSKNLEPAHKLINFMLSPDVNVAFVKNVLGGPVLKTTKASLPVELQQNASLFPSPEVLSKFEFIHDLGDFTQAYDDLWTKIKTSE